MIKRIGLIVHLITGLCFYSHASLLSNSIAEIETTLHVSVVYDSVVPDSWAAVTYSIIKDSGRVETYLELLLKEYEKYPAGYFETVGVNTIILGRNLKYSDQNRAAVPDPYQHSLYFSVDGAYGDSSEIYLIHVMHHELNHCTEYSRWNDMNYKSQQWKKANPFFFRYLGAGADAYNNLSIDWYKMDHPRRGFINLYSTTAQEEDRSEIVALIMSDQERNYLFTYCTHDKRLKKKVKLILNYLDNVSHTSTNYWTTEMAQVN